MLYRALKEYRKKSTEPVVYIGEPYGLTLRNQVGEERFNNAG